MRIPGILLLLTLALPGCTEQQGDLLDKVIASEHRDAKNVARTYIAIPRNPVVFRYYAGYGGAGNPARRGLVHVSWRLI